MRVAIPTFGSRISPRFDCAGNLLIVEIADGSVSGRTQQPLAEVPGWRRVHLLVSLETNVVLTGGIRRCDYFALLNSGMEVYAGLVGDIEENLRRYLSGNLPRFGFGFDPAAGQVRHGRRHGRRGPHWR